MNIRFAGLVIIYSVFAASMLTNSSSAYFTDTASSSQNTFSTAETFGEDEETGGIVINEIFPSGDNNEEIVELYNSSNSPINISNWTIEDNNTTDTFPPGLVDVGPGEYALILTNSSTYVSSTSALIITLANATIGNGLHADGDKLILKNIESSIVDSMSYGNNTDIFSGIPTPTPGQSLQRTPNGIDTDSSGDWSTGAITLGESN